MSGYGRARSSLGITWHKPRPRHNCHHAYKNSFNPPLFLYRQLYSKGYESFFGHVHHGSTASEVAGSVVETCVNYTADCHADYATSITFLLEWFKAGNWWGCPKCMPTRSSLRIAYCLMNILFTQGIVGWHECLRTDSQKEKYWK